MPLEIYEIIPWTRERIMKLSWLNVFNIGLKYNN